MIKLIDHLLQYGKATATYLMIVLSMLCLMIVVGVAVVVTKLSIFIK